MQFTVPQFIEHEAKIIWFFTFKQFIFIGLAVAISIIFFFTLGKKNFTLFALIAISLTGLALALAFLKIGGRSITTVLKNSFFFLLAPKIYLWKKKETAPKFIRITKTAAKKEEEKTHSLKFAEKSRLKKLSTKIETRI